MGHNKRDTDKAGEDHSDSRKGGEAYKTVGKNLLRDIAVLVSIILGVVVPCVNIMHEVKNDLKLFENQLAAISSRIRPPHTEWTRLQMEQFTKTWKQRHPEHDVPEIKKFGYIGLDGQFHYPE